MALRVETQIVDGVFILHCQGRIVFGDEGAVLRERVNNMPSGTPRIVVDLARVDHIDSGGLRILVGLFVSAKIAAANSSWSLPIRTLRKCFAVRI
jgi:anti-anti-sigma factor